MARSYEQIAYEVIDGDWGVYPERKERLEAAGYNYQTVMNYVNKILYGANNSDSTDNDEKDVLTIHFDPDKYSAIKVVFE